MGPGYRSLRAAASALLVAAAVGTGGMTGMTSVLAADPGMVTVSGSLAGAGAPLGGVELTITEELVVDGGMAAFKATTGADGSFAADLYAWGTTDAPALITITTAEDITVESESCSQTWGVATTFNLALAEAAPDPLAVDANLLGEVCGTTGTPAPTNPSTPNTPGRGNTGAGITPPPTNTSPLHAATTPDRAGPALTLGFMVGLLLAAIFLMPRPRARRRG